MCVQDLYIRVQSASESSQFRDAEELHSRPDAGSRQSRRFQNFRRIFMFLNSGVPLSSLCAVACCRCSMLLDHRLFSSLFLPLSLSLYHKLVTVRFERDGGERVQLGTADPRSWVLGSNGLPPPTCQQGAAVGEYAMPQGLGADLIHVGFCFRVLAEFWEACWCRVG